MQIHEEFKKLEIEGKDGEETLPFLTVIFVLLYLLAYLTEKLPLTVRLPKVQETLRELFNHYIHYYKEARFQAPHLATRFGKYSSFSLNGQARVDSPLPNGFNWKRLEALFKDYRSPTK